MYMHHFCCASMTAVQQYEQAERASVREANMP